MTRTGTDDHHTSDAARRLRAIRHTMELSQGAFADLLRLGRWGFQRIGCWERGVSKTPGHVVRLAELLMTTDQRRAYRRLLGDRATDTPPGADRASGASADGRTAAAVPTGARPRPADH